MNGRRVATVCLVVLTCVLTLVSAIALWLRALVLNTDSYVRAVGPVLDHPAVRDALAETIVDELYSHVDVTARLRDALPKAAAEFAPTLAASIRTTSVQVASAALATSEVRQAWRAANRVAHDQVVRVLEGKGQVVTTAKGEVAIDTGALAADVRRALDTNGIHVFDSVRASALDRRFVLFQSTDLMHAQQATRLLDDVATWLPIATIAVGVGAIVCATRRRRAVEYLAVGIAGVMVLIAVGAAVGRAYYLARVGSVNRTIAAAPFDALVGPLRAWTRLTFVIALVTLAVLWLAGSGALVEHERQARSVVAELMHEHARTLAVAGAAGAAVVLVAWDKPRPLVVYSTLATLALWELLCLVAGRAARTTVAAAVRPHQTDRVHFRAEHDFPGSPTAVAAILSDPAFHTRLDLPDLSRPEVLENTVAGAAHTLRLRYEFVGHLDPIARRLLAGRRLTWIQELQLDSATGRGRLSFAAEGEAKKLYGHATVTLSEIGDGRTRRTVDGDLYVKVPMVGGTAERRIVPGLVARLDVEAAALTATLTGAS